MKVFVLLLLLPIAGSSLRLTQRAKSSNIKSQILSAASAAEAYELYLAAYTDVEDARLRSSPRAAARRKRAFVSNLAAIKQHNRGSSEYEMGVNSFTMMERGERQQFLGAVRNLTEILKAGTKARNGVAAALNAPSHKSWRSLGYITPVKNQGGCGSCWAFAATVPLEFIYAVAKGEVRSLSEQLYLDCTYESDGRDGCNGGSSSSVWEWVQETGYAWDANSIEYQGRDRYCTYSSYNNAFAGVVKIAEIKVAYDHEATIYQMEDNMVAGLQDGPIVNYFRVENDFYAYSSGYYDGCWTEDSDGWHAVSTVGYTSAAWEVKNSWGQDWGSSGYIYFKRGRNICHFSEYALWLIGEDLDDSDDGGDIDNDDRDDDGDGDETCQDTPDYQDNCPNWAKNNYCTTGDYIQFMADHCAKSCGHCGDKEDEVDPDCQNKMPTCPALARAGKCEENPDFMLVNCKESCNACGRDDDDDGGDDDNDDDVGRFLRADRVAMTSQYLDRLAEYAVDGDLNTASHTECSGRNQWFKYYFDGMYRVGKVKVINGKFNSNRVRLDGVQVYAMFNDRSMRQCPVSVIRVRDGSSIEDQTYWLDCGGEEGMGVWFFQSTENCLEFTEIEVYEAQ